MYRLRKKTTATLLIAIFMISAFAVAVSVNAVLTTITYSGNTLNECCIRYEDYSLDPNNEPVTLIGTVDPSGLESNGAVMIGLIDKQHSDDGESGFMGGAYIYFGRRTNNLVIGPSDGNIGGEIVQTFVTMTDYFTGAMNPIDYSVTIGGGSITITLGDQSLIDTYGEVKTLNNADAYPWAEFEHGAYIGIDGWPPENDLQYTISFEVDVPTKADILHDKGVPGKGIDKAPGLDKLPPNDNFGGRNGPNHGHGPGPHNRPNGGGE